MPRNVSGRILAFLFLFSFLLYNASFSQNIIDKKHIEIVPDKNLSAGGFHTFLFGNNWRNLWTKPVKIEIINLKKFDGVLFPVKKLTDTDSKTLLFQSKTGEYWEFRAFNIDPEKIFSDEILENAANSLLKDQISIINPFASLISNTIVNEVDSLNIKSVLVFLPDDQNLGIFQKEFGGLPGILDNKIENINKCDSLEIIDTDNLMEKLNADYNNVVDAKKYLLERLIDIFLGDWSRGADKWNWLKNRKGKRIFWIPVPKERILAFSKIDGLAGISAVQIVTELCSFDEDYPDIKKITYTGRFLDRRILTELDKFTWDSVTNDLYKKLSDSLLISSVKRLPQEDIIVGEKLQNDLISRRNKLPVISNDYYNLINAVADIYTTGYDDSAVVNRLNDNITEVSLFSKKGKETNKFSNRYFKKSFDNRVTDEIRIHLGNGNDETLVKGNVDESPLVRIIGGEGKDEIQDNSVVNGYLFSFIPIPVSENKTEFYESYKNTTLTPMKSSDIYYSEYSNPVKKNIYDFDGAPEQKDRGHEWLFLPEFSYDENNGFVFGGGPLLYKYDFGYVPFKYRMSLTASYATRSQSINLFYDGNFYSLIKNVDVGLNFKKSELDLIKFFGYGNETAFNKELDSKDFYLLKQKLIGFYPDASLKFSDIFSCTLGFSLENSDVSLRNSEILLKDFPYDRYGIGRFTIAGINSSIEYNYGDQIYNTFRGYHFKLMQEYFPKLLDNRNSFTKTSFDIRAFFTGNIFTETTFALRGGGEKIWGRFPLFKSVLLGGNSNLPGYSRERFAGNASLFGQFELRFLIKEFEIILKEKFGMSLFSEAGRVFSESGESKKWHPSYGFGFWSSVIQRKINLSVIFAFSPEGMNMYADTKFLF